MSDDRDIFYAIFGLGAGVLWFFNGFKVFREKQLIDNIPTSTVRGLAMGMVELSGKAGREVPLKGPLSREDCVAYTYLIERYEKRGKSSSWVTVASGNSFQCPFYLEDDTGRITVVPQGAEFISDVDFSYTTGWGQQLTSNLISFMNSSGVSYGGLFGNYTMRFTERNIKPGEDVFVLGTAKKTSNIDNDQQDHRSQLMKRLDQLKGDSKFMASVDENKDGNVSDDEWKKAVSRVEQDLLQDEIAKAAVLQFDDVIVGQGEEERTFIVSDKSQKDLDATFTWKIIGGVFGGAALAVGCLWYLLTRFHIY